MTLGNVVTFREVTCFYPATLGEKLVVYGALYQVFVFNLDVDNGRVSSLRYVSDSTGANRVKDPLPNLQLLYRDRTVRRVN